MWSSKLYGNRNNLLGPYKAKSLSFISCQWPWSLNSQINSTRSLSPSRWCTVISFSPAPSALYSRDTPSVLLTLLLFTLFSPFSPLSHLVCQVCFSLFLISLQHFHLMTRVSSYSSLHYVSLPYCYSGFSEMQVSDLATHGLYNILQWTKNLLW